MPGRAPGPRRAVPARPGPARAVPPRNPDGPRLAVEALAVAKADARARGYRPAGFGHGPDQNDDPERPGLSADAHSGAPGTAGAGRRGRPRREDPQLLASAIGGLLDTH